MASSPTLTANPTSVPTGGTSQIKVAFALAAGGTVTVTLSEGGNAQATTQVTIPAETFPAIKLAGEAASPTDYVLTTSQGTLARTSDPSVFTLQV